MCGGMIEDPLHSAHQ